MKKKGIKKYILGIEGAAAGEAAAGASGAGAAGATGAAGAGGTAAGAGSFKDKAGAFMGNYGGAITSAASSLMPLLMKKPDPNAKPYKKGSKLIKYQEGTQKTIVADPNDPDNLHEYFKRRSKEAKALREASEPQGEMGPTRKEVADFMRKYNAVNKNNPNIIGSIDEDEFNARAQQLQDLGISEPIKKSSPPSLIPSKQASLKFTQQSLPTPKLNKVAIDKPSRRERKAEDKRMETLARAPITYSENTFAGPSDEELKTGKAKQDAEARQDKQLKDSFQSDVLGKTIPKSKTVSTEKNPILYKEKKNLVTYNRGDFNTFSAADKKKYRENIAKGVAFSIGDRKYAAATPAEKAFSKRMAKGSSIKSAEAVKPSTAASTDNKQSTHYFNSSGTANKNVVIKGIKYYTNNRALEQKTGRKGDYDARKGKIVWDAKKNKPTQNSNKSIVDSFKSLFTSKEDSQREEKLQAYLNKLGKKK